jgi:hypothetical protein
MARSRATGDAATERAASIELQTTRSQLTTLDQRRNALVLRAPFSGMLSRRGWKSGSGNALPRATA